MLRLSESGLGVARCMHALCVYKHDLGSNAVMR